MLTLDHIEPIHLSDAVVRRYQNELGAINRVWFGLDLIYQHTLQMELSICRSDPRFLTSCAWGNIPGIAPNVLTAVGNFLDWYSVSASKLVELVGWLGLQEDDTRKSPKEYTNEVLGPVKNWRDSVGAHFARSNGRADSTTVKMASPMTPAGFANGRFVAHPMQFFRAIGNNQPGMSGAKIPSWSITETHQQLRARYAPTATDEAPASPRPRRRVTINRRPPE